MAIDLKTLRERIEGAELNRTEGRVAGTVGLTVEAHIPGVKRGDWVRIERKHLPPLEAEVIAFMEERARLMPLGDLQGLSPGDPVIPTGRPLTLPCGDALRGRILDGLGQPIDGGPALSGQPWDVHRDAPAPLERRPITRPLSTGVRCIDALNTLGEGQRMGIFAGSGVGKSTLMAQLARQTDADLRVFCLVGERGRELNSLLDSLDPETLSDTVVVCATSDTPALTRVKSLHVATAISEYFRDQGQRVLLLVDSLTRFVRASREVALAGGEPPARRGYPQSAFSALAPLIERAGMGARGCISAFYTVLVEGDDLDEPVSDEVRGLLDGHLVLSRALAARGRMPCIDTARSLSRVMNDVVAPEHASQARRLRDALAYHESRRDLVRLGAYQPGSDPRLDMILGRIDAIERFLRQPKDLHGDMNETLTSLARLAPEMSAD